MLGKDGKARYYSPDGKSLRKAFLRTPVDFTRISSGFSLGRFHPILNTIRAHKGVDYAAPRGTAIKAAGDGKMTFKGTKNGYGNVIEITHDQHHSTLYAHMDGFAKGLSTGATVKAGQVIGYVGSTGLATGPHLHYELRVDGVHRDPLKVNVALADNLDGRELQSFKTQAGSRLATLANHPTPAPAWLKTRQPHPPIDQRRPVVRYLGLMSGTSSDGIDAALIRIDSAGVALEATLSHPLPGRLARQIRAIARHPAGGTLDAALTLDLQLGRCFARAALTLIRQAAPPRNRFAPLACMARPCVIAPNTAIPIRCRWATPSAWRWKRASRPWLTGACATSCLAAKGRPWCRCSTPSCLALPMNQEPS